MIQKPRSKPRGYSLQNLADIAFELLLDTGLAVSDDKETLKHHRAKE